MRKLHLRIDVIRWSLLLLSVGLLPGCSTYKPGLTPLPVQSQQWKKVALVQEMILPPSLPVAPLVQAGIYRSLYSSIEVDVVKLQQDRIDEYEEILGQRLSTGFPFTVLYGKDLLKVDAFKNIDSTSVKTFGTKMSGQNANSIVIPARGYNFFDLTMEKANPRKEFDAKTSAFLDAHAGSLSALCKSLDVDSILVASLYLDTPSVNFLAQGPKKLNLTVVFFDRDGKLCHSATAWSMGIASTGGDMEAYAKTMDLYPKLVEELVQGLKNEKAGDAGGNDWRKAIR